MKISKLISILLILSLVSFQCSKKAQYIAGGVVLLLAIGKSQSDKEANAAQGSFVSNNYGLNPKLAMASQNTLSDALITVLLPHGFKIVERSKLADVLGEQILRQAGIIKDDKLIEAGRILNVDALVFVTTETEFLQPNQIKSAFVRVVDVKSGLVMGSLNYQSVYKYGDPITEVANRLGKKMVRGLRK